MVYIINIISPTKDNDPLYKQVSVNTWPIVWISESIEDLWENKDLKKLLKDIIKTKKVYENAMLYCRVFNDKMELVKNEKIKLSDKIKNYEE